MATKKDRPSSINVPNALTLLRVVAVPIFGWMLLAHAHEGGWRTTTTIVFMVAILTASSMARLLVNTTSSPTSARSVIRLLTKH